MCIVRCRDLSVDRREKKVSTQPFQKLAAKKSKSINNSKANICSAIIEQALAPQASIG